MTTTPTTILWITKKDSEAKIVINLLTRLEISFELRDLSTGKWKWSDVIAAIPTAKDLPQLVLNGTLIGGLKEIMSNDTLKMTPEKYAASMKKFINS